MLQTRTIAKWKTDFDMALEQTTSGSQGHTLEKILYQEMDDYRNFDEYKAVEELAEGLCSLGTIVTPRAFTKLTRAACYILIEKLYLEANLQDAERRERAWYDKPITGTNP